MPEIIVFARPVNGCLRRLQREADALQSEVDRDESVALEHPQWLLGKLRNAWPDQWRAIARANNEPGPMTLRVNQRHNDREAYLQQLTEQGLNGQLCLHAPDGITLTHPCDVSVLPGFDQGHVSVQDEAAQLCAALLGPALAPRPGAHVLDACCAPGGKTAHLLEQFDISLTALDSDNRDRFLELLLTLAERSNSSVVFVSHDQSLAGHLHHRMALEVAP